jgi:hypothetical protein
VLSHIRPHQEFTHIFIADNTYNRRGSTAHRMSTRQIVAVFFDW